NLVEKFPETLREKIESSISVLLLEIKVARVEPDLSWRRKELSDLKVAVRVADAYSKPVLLRAIITMSYAHWEGFIRTCANRYFEHLTLRKKQFIEFERQIYVNS